MPDLSFQVEGSMVQQFSVTPTLIFKLLVTNSQKLESVQSIMLRCQIQIESNRRNYNAQEQEQLLDIFGEPRRWSQTLQPILWANISIVVPPFINNTLVDLPVPCTFDFNVASTKYFAGLKDGEVPISFQFSGTVFYSVNDSAWQVAQIPWNKEASHRLPIKIWQELIEIYYPNSAWLCLRRDIFDHLYNYKMKQGLATFEQALELLLNTKEKG